MIDLKALLFGFVVGLITGIFISKAKHGDKPSPKLPSTTQPVTLSTDQQITRINGRNIGWLDEKDK